MLQANMKRTEFGDMNGEDDDAEEERIGLISEIIDQFGSKT